MQYLPCIRSGSTRSAMLQSSTCTAVCGDRAADKGLAGNRTDRAYDKRIPAAARARAVGCCATWRRVATLPMHQHLTARTLYSGAEDQSIGSLVRLNLDHIQLRIFKNRGNKLNPIYYGPC
eukprot:SAG31_NODE_779_length_12158_cov_8.740194_7_plen_121_part_00